jgi:signal transduction histidine kinase
MATIACVDLDPLLVDLVRRVRPGDQVMEVTPEELHASRPFRWAAVVMSSTSEALHGLGDSPLAERTVLIGVARATHPGPVLGRPVQGSDLRLALSRVLRASGRLATMRAALRDLPHTMGATGILGVLRAGGLAAAVALDATQPGGIVLAPVVAVLILWVAIRVPFRALSVPFVSIDALLILGAVLLTGGTASPYLLLGAIVAAEVGYAFPPREGAILIGLASLAAVAELAGAFARGQAETTELVALASIIPLASLAGVLAARIGQTREVDHLRTLRQLNQTLERLSKQAQEMAGSLSIGTVTEAVLDTVQEEFGAIAAVLLVDEAEPGRVRIVAGSFGLTSTPPPRVVDDTRSPSDIPTEVVVRLPAGERLVAPVVSGTVERGCLIVVVPPDQRTRGLNRRLAALADEAALALDNARVFEGIRSLTVDEERGRLARDLHDGVIQSLVHVGFELDLLASQLSNGTRDEATRLRKVVGQAVDEVRGTVQGLRSVRLTDGLGPALRSLSDEFGGGQVVVEADVAPVDGLTPEAELQLLRIAQEAVSNALQHASPTRVDVLFWSTEDEVHLQVSDNGIGMQAREVGGVAGRGVGLQAMQERAELLGASLSVEAGVQGGTCVRVDIPWGRIRS